MQKLFFLLLLFLALLRAATHDLGYPKGKAIELTDRIRVDPVTYESSRLVTINGIRAYVELFPEINYGDMVTLEGLVQGDKLEKAKVIAVGPGGGIYKVRRSIIEIYKRQLPEPHSSLVAGVVLGSKADMPRNFWEKLTATGTAHVVVASGMNVTFVISFVLNTLVNFIKRGRAIIISVIFAWVYVLLSGFDAPLVRAATMGTIVFSAQAMGRTSTALRALFISAAVMIILVPVWIHDLGFALSFLATLSIIVFEAKISRLLSRVPFLFKKDLATTLAAQIGVTPVLLFSFGNINIFSPIINSFILWTIPPIMIIGAMAGIVEIIIPQLGEAIILLSYPFTSWFVGVIDLVS